MAKDMTIDLRLEANEFRKWIHQKVSLVAKGKAAKSSSKPIGAIVALYCYVQDGWIALDFNTDDEFEFDGDVSKVAWRDLFQRPTWQAFAESEDTASMTFIEADGTKSSKVAAKMTDRFLSTHFGKMIAEALTAAWNDGVFSSLALKPKCVLSVNDFNGNWGWEARKSSGERASA
ncbi:MAG: hypothetical protein ACR2FY_17420 [Pirellulaceae bacterium]